MTNRNIRIRKTILISIVKILFDVILEYISEYICSLLKHKQSAELKVTARKMSGHVSDNRVCKTCLLLQYIILSIVVTVSDDIATGTLCTVMTDTCSTGYECQNVVDGYIVCVHQCLLDSPKCGVHGHCYYDTSFKSTKCR